MNSNLKYIGEDLDTKSIRYLTFDRSVFKQVEQYCATNSIKLRKHRIIVEEAYSYQLPSSVNTNIHKHQRATNGYFFENEEDESLICLKFNGEYRHDISFTLNQEYEQSTNQPGNSYSDVE